MIWGTDDIPAQWPIQPLSALTSKVGSGATPRGGAATYAKTGIPLIRSQNVRFEGFTHDGLAFLSDSQAKQLDNVKVENGDVLLNITGASIGRVSIAPEDMSGARVNQHVCIIRPTDRLLPSFLAAYLSAPQIQDAIAIGNYGVTREALTKSQILELPVPVPDLLEQEAIVGLLSLMGSKRLRALAEVGAAHLAIERFRQAVLAAACSGRLTADWRREQSMQRFPATSLLDDFLAGAAEETAAYHQGVELPEGWTCAPVKLLFRIQNGRAFPSKQYASSGIRLLRPGNLNKDGIVDWDADKTVRLPWVWADQFPQYILGPGELLMNLTAQSLKDEFLGRACLKEDNEPALLNQRIARFINVGDFDVRPYALIYFKSIFFRRFVNGLDSGTLIRHMHSRQVQDHLLLLPPAEEQTEIVRRAKQLLKLAENLQNRIEKASLRVDQSSQAILAKAFRGELIGAES